MLLFGLLPSVLCAIAPHVRLHAPPLPPTAAPLAHNDLALPDKWLAETLTIATINGTNPQGFINMTKEYTAEDTKAEKHVVLSIGDWGWSPKSWVKAGNATLNITTIEFSHCESVLNCSLYTLLNIGNSHYIETIQPKGSFRGTFDWVAYAKHEGNISFRNESVIRYVLNVGTKVNYELLIGADGNPRRNTLNATIPKEPPTPYSGSKYSEVIEFYNFQRDKFISPDPTAKIDLNTYLHPKTCTLDESRAYDNITMFIFHPAHDFNVGGQDLGDAKGDTYFTCVDLLTEKPGAIDHDYQWITQYRIEANTKFGQYQNCNGYNPPRCVGVNNFYVGHSGAQNQGPSPNNGQCVTNSLVGEWYSLPVGGKCQGSATPHGGKCTWSKNHVKTIDSKCLIKQHKFKEACAQDGHAPFARATKVFKRAFEMDDISSGGCPPLPYR